MMKLVLKSSISKKTWEFSVRDNNDSKLFYHFREFQLTEPMDDGEYGYELYDADDVLVAQGLLQIGDYKPDGNKTYDENENKTYKQYQG